MSIAEYENYQEKKSHGALTFPYTTYPCSIPLDFSRVPLHWHDEMELVYIKKGQGIITVDFITYEMSAGDILVILPGQLHSIEQKKGDSMEYENIIFQLDMLFPRQEDLCVNKYFLPLLQRQIEIPVYLTPEWEDYEKAAEIAKEALKTNQPVRKLILEKGIMNEEQLNTIMDPYHMTEPGIPGKDPMNLLK